MRPCGVNFSALPARFSSTWRQRRPSASTWSGTPGPTAQPSTSPRCAACTCSGASVWCSTSRSSSGSGRSSSLSASMREMSSRSLMICISVCADCCTSCRWCRCWSSSGPASTTSVRPSTPFIGVRISWLMWARKLLLARLAASAASRACSSAVCAAFRSLMSRALTSSIASPLTGSRTARASSACQQGPSCVCSSDSLAWACPARTAASRASASVGSANSSASGQAPGLSSTGPNAATAAGLRITASVVSSW